MNANEVSRDDAMVIDREGTLWVYEAWAKGWRYLTTDDDGETVFSWDHLRFLHESYQPYTRLDAPAQTAVRLFLSTLHV